MSMPIVAVVGRPNVGKSSFFNVIAGERISIVDPTPGVTRDRVMQQVEWIGRHFWLIDTGGIEDAEGDVIKEHMRLQAEIAIDMADVVILMTDLKEGLHPVDEEIAQMLRAAHKRVVVVVNKSDHVGEDPPGIYEFYALGLGDVHAMSAAHKLGLSEVMDAVLAELPEVDAEPDSDTLKIAVIGKPNAGKSSLVNRLLGQNRTIVSSVAGTTRDAIDETMEYEGKSVVLIDTAGLRKRGQIERGIEKYAMIRALSAIERADVCVVMIDGVEGVTAQDTKIAGLSHQAGKATILVVNKWDAVDKEETSHSQMQEIVRRRFQFVSYAPLLFLSAKTGANVNRLLPLAFACKESSLKQIGTSVLNTWLSDAVAMHPTPQDKGRHLKIYYATQVASQPPTFVLFVNDPLLTHFSYTRYLENRLRDSFGFEGTPLRFIYRGRGEQDDSLRRDLGTKKKER
ncbi:MAG TPA: ribosome biogenesis GTPase Der [Fastidiosipila sp.]|nr:ribosome biogenesis GTPase Der [Fastidiosipila sp.]